MMGSIGLLLSPACDGDVLVMLLFEVRRAFKILLRLLSCFICRTDSLTIGHISANASSSLSKRLSRLFIASIKKKYINILLEDQYKYLLLSSITICSSNNTTLGLEA